VPRATTFGKHLVELGLLLGLLGAIVLVVIALVQYPPASFAASTSSEYFLLGILAIVALLGAAAGLAFQAARFWRGRAIAGPRAAIAVGLLLGVFWVIEIGFNNFVPPEISTASARSIIDNGFWALIGVSMVVLSGVVSFRGKRLRDGLEAGFWSGLASGLIACLMGLLIATVWMNFLLRDPLNVQEFAQRGATSGAPDMATYLAYQTMAGAIMHLFVLGLGMGVVLGFLGGLVGWGLSAARRIPEQRASS
jgi:hypothetical protein